MCSKALSLSIQHMTDKPASRTDGWTNGRAIAININMLSRAKMEDSEDSATRGINKKRILASRTAQNRAFSVLNYPTRQCQLRG